MNTQQPPNDDQAAPETPVTPAVSVVQDEAAIETAVLDVETANAAQTRATGRSVARATAGIVPLHALRLLIGFVAQPLIAHNLGLRWQADAYAVSTDILQRIWLIFEKVVNPAFLPCFIGALKEEGEARAWRFTSTAVMLTALALVMATPLAWFFMPNIVGIYSQKSSPQQIALTIQIARLLLAGLFFLGMSSLTYVILNGYKRFAVAALGDTLWKLGVFGGAVVVAALHLPPEEALTVIAVGFIVGAFFKLFPHVLAIGRKWQYFRPRIDWSDPLTRKMLLLAVPLVCGILVSEARGIYLQRLADDPRIQVEAGRAAIKWSRIIGDNLIQIFPYALSIGIFPFLADLARDKDKQPLTDTLIGALRVCVFVFGPLTAILIALRFPLLRAVWESGRLTHADTIAMSGPFVGFTIGLIGFACEMMLNQTFYAMTNAWTPTLIGMGTSVLWIAIAILGIDNGYGLAAIAGAESISKTTKCVLMWLLLRPHLGHVRVRENVVFALKVLFGAIVAAFIASVVADSIAPAAGAPQFKIKMLLAVTFAGCSGVVVYIVLGALAGVHEVRQVFNFVGKLRRRFARA